MRPDQGRTRVDRGEGDRGGRSFGGRARGIRRGPTCRRGPTRRRSTPGLWSTAAALTLLLVVVPFGLLVGPLPGAAQEMASVFSPEVAERPPVSEALSWLEENFEAQVEEWIRLGEIPAPSGREEERGRYMRAAFEAEGLEVRVDSIGNVEGRRPGTGDGPTVVIAGHMDTVHGLDVDHTVRREGGRLHAPGISDDTKSLSNMLAVIRALNRHGIETTGDLIFLATVQEEVGLKGMEYWLEHHPTPEMVIAVDGGFGRVRYGALGIYWSRYFFRGDGAHTNASAGAPHPVRALSRAVLSIYEIEVPEGRGGAVYNVGMVEGGDVFNAIPQEVSLTVDLRSVNPVLLDSLHAEIGARVARAAAEEGVEWAREEELRLEAGGTEEMLADRLEHPLVGTAVDVHRHLDIPVEAAATGSTDANAAVVRGIPAIAVGGSYAGNVHTVQEWADIPSALDATRMLLLLVVSLGDGG